MLLRYRYKHSITNEILYEESFTPPVINVKPNSLTVVGQAVSSGSATTVVEINLIGNTNTVVGPLALGTYSVKVNKKVPVNGAPTAKFEISKIDATEPAQVHDIINISSNVGETLIALWNTDGNLYIQKFSGIANNTYNGLYTVKIE
jgi:hypothetical protein